MSKQLLKDTTIYAGADIVLKVISFFTFPILANLLSVTQMGEITLAATIAGIFSLFGNLGLNNAVQRFYFDEQTKTADRKQVVSTALILQTLVTILFIVVTCLATYPFRDWFLERYNMPWAYFAISMIALLPIQIITFCSDAIRLQFKPLKFLILNLIKNLAALVGGIIALLYWKGNVTLYLWVGALLPLAFVPIALVFIKNDFTLHYHKAWGKKMYKFGYPFVFAGLAYWIFGGMDRWLLAELSDNTQVGIYSVGFKLASVIALISSAFGQAWSPYMIKRMNENKNYKQEFAQVFQLFLLVLSVCSIYLCLFTKEFYVFLTPEEYWSAADVSVITITGLVIYATTQLTSMGISISQKTNILTSVTWITAAINLLLNYLFIPYWGAVGAALATTITYLFLTICYLYFTNKYHPFPFNYLNLFVNILLITLFTIAGMYFNRFDSLKMSFIKVLVSFLFLLIVYIANRKIINTGYFLLKDFLAQRKNKEAQI